MSSEYLENVEESGQIEQEASEGLVYFDNLYPVRYSSWDIRQKLVSRQMRTDSTLVQDYIKQVAIPPDLPIEVSHVVPRIGEGGAIMHFKTVGNVLPTEVHRKIQAYMDEQGGIRPWFNPFQSMRAFAVKGRPWIEDLRRFPSARLRVEFEGPDLSQEELFFHFRRYGRMRDIIPLSPSSKDLPRYATIQYISLRAATSARNCLNDLVVGETRLHIAYDSVDRHYVRDMFVNHPRISIPLVAALLAALTVAVFDPIRTWFIKQKITKRFSLSDNVIVQTLTRWTRSTLDSILYNAAPVHEDFQSVWTDRQEKVEKIKTWLSEKPGNFFVIYGPKGSGKDEIVYKQALVEHHNVLSLDCVRLVEQRSDASFIKEIASQVGYRPVFSWTNNVSTLLDVVVQGMIGQKAGFSESKEVQFKKILDNTARALKDIATTCDHGDHGADDSDAIDEEVSGRPIVVVNHFLHQHDHHEDMYEHLAEWAAVLTMGGIAHVLFITDEVGYSKVLSDALPNNPLVSVSVGDATREVARDYVLRHMQAAGESKEPTANIESAIAPLGGRMTDLQNLVRRITIGEPVDKAVQEMVRQSASDIIKRYLRSSNKSWTPDQTWYIVRELAEHDDLRYNELTIHPLFAASPDAITALEHSELITVTDVDGRPYSIKAGRPIYRAAFQRLVADRGLSAKQEISLATALTKIETEKISKCENELSTLTGLGAVKAVNVAERAQYLVRKIQKSQRLIEGYDNTVDREKVVLASNY
ncbi:RNA12 protein-domain-containing protein [Dipodascopsis tothii]|uniref:RNA12 protein-domain-containing protein n=1 Tax=Dipodascopsis tothii TaxID=44089 RepID=UPI0034CDE4B6